MLELVLKGASKISSLYTAILTFFCSTILLVTQQRFSEDADILEDLAPHLQGQQTEVGPETVAKCAWRVVWNMLHADDACNRVVVTMRIGAKDDSLRLSSRRTGSDYPLRARRRPCTSRFRARRQRW
ncbi:unnamed protein product [Ascophyllum nodosum]